jgi:putative acetyltransferase
MVIIEKITGTKRLPDIIHLFGEYITELNEDLGFQNVGGEIENPLKKYGGPAGCILLAYENDTAVGCVALQPLPGNICEMKRLYIKPAYRKSGIGKLMVEKILQEASDKRYTAMVLDTLERLQPAIRLYEQFGFEHVEAYYQNPLANVVYMQKKLEGE